MLILGISGGINRVHKNRYGLPWLWHDGAAVLVEDGKIRAGIEEERLNRLKHTTCFPVHAIRYCLEECQVTLNQVDKIAFYFTSAFKDIFYHFHHIVHKPYREPFPGIEAEIRNHFKDAFGMDTANKLCFVNHHLAHAYSAYIQSGFEKCLVLVTDGLGDDVSSSVYTAQQARCKLLQTYGEPDSLGILYWYLITSLGYNMFDEYKVMGLAPYGDPSVYRKTMKSFYKLLPMGKYQINRGLAILTIKKIIKTREPGEAFTQQHKDFAAALQECLEDILMHMLSYYRETTQLNHLALAGGVAHNCVFNGKLLNSGLFDRVFAHPAAHDAGAALGAALYMSEHEKPGSQFQPLEHVYWGPDIGTGDEILQELTKWEDLIHFEKMDNIIRHTAELLSQGYVIGWVQGRSEFGPRALGNRSILADPRPAQNKTIINQMVKKREGYRPFAPSVLQEYVDEYFVVPPGIVEFPYMIFAVPVHEDKRELLGAITHVDGTARIQTVSKNTNPKYWELISAFQEFTGIPILLNTSFNNNVEPIVDSVKDAVVCFLTTGLHYLVVGNYFISKKEVDDNTYLSFIPSLPAYVELNRKKSFEPGKGFVDEYTIENIHDIKSKQELSPGVYDFLMKVDGSTTIDAILSQLSANPQYDVKKYIKNIKQLWAKRLININKTIKKIT